MTTWQQFKSATAMKTAQFFYTLRFFSTTQDLDY